MFRLLGRSGWRTATGALGLALAWSSHLDAAPFNVGGDPRVDPSRFRVTTFASGLNFPYGIQAQSDGSFLVATSRPATTSYFNSTGELIRLVDDDDDGRADGSGTVLYSGLPGVVTALAKAGSLWLATSARSGQERISVLREGATPADPLTLVGEVRLSFPSPWQHKSYALAVRDVPGNPQQHELFFNVGSQYNFGSATNQATASGLVTANLDDASIYRLTLSDDGANVSLGTPERIARGLRNAAGLAFQPVTGDLYFADNGIDTPGNVSEPLSVDELNRLTTDQIGGPVDDFGFPASYIEYRTGNVVGSGGIAPLVTFQPLGDRFAGSESEGPTEITFAPPGFPDGLNKGVFLGFHGQSNTAGPVNEENPLVYVDLDSGAYFHFVGNDAPVGHLDSLLALGASLFAVDLSTTGSLTGGVGTGAIYQIKYQGPPLVGDANGDGSVGTADYAQWAAQFGQSGQWLSADFDDNGSVGAGDYALWAANFGHTSGESGATSAHRVPEPSTGCILATAALVGGWAGSRRYGPRRR